MGSGVWVLAFLRSVWWSCILIFISLMTSDVWSFSYLSCCQFFFGLFLNQIVCSLIIAFEEFSVCFGQQSFIWCVFHKYFLPVCGLSSNSRDVVFTEQFLISMKCSLWILLGVMLLVSCSVTLPKLLSSAAHPRSLPPESCSREEAGSALGNLFPGR